ncbi:MAG: hypothetical protein U1F56_19190 [Rubrivivax sp.]
MHGALGTLAALLCATAQGQLVALPKYYEAKDLGAVSEYRPLGCIAPNGTVGLTRRLAEPPYGTNDRAVVYSPFGDFKLFYRFGMDSWAQGCNSRGEFVGQGDVAQGVIWDVEWNSGPQILPGTQKGPAEPLALNDKRQVVGRVVFNVDSNGTDYLATLWTTSQVPEDPQVSVTTLFAGEAVAINSVGQIAATRVDWTTGKRAAVFVTNGGASVTKLLPDNVGSSDAAGIDEKGMVVGHATDSSGKKVGFVWSPYTMGYTLLGPARVSTSPLTHSLPRAISSLGMVIVGQSHNTTKAGSVTTPRATVWPQAGTARNLNDEASMANGGALTFTLTDAIGVAADGRVLCEGRTSDGKRRAVLLTPRPGGSWS